MLERLAHIVMRRRWYFIAAWIGLTMLGAYSAQAVSTPLAGGVLDPRLLRLRGEPAHARDLRHGRPAAARDRPQRPGRRHEERRRSSSAIDKVAAEFPDFRVASFFSTRQPRYVSDDGRTMFATFYPPGQQGFDAETFTGEIRDAFAAAVPPGVDVHLTGQGRALRVRGRRLGRPERAHRGADRRPRRDDHPALRLRDPARRASCRSSWRSRRSSTRSRSSGLLTYITSVSLIVQFLVALVGLGVAIDYALLMIFRFRDELRHGADTETALVETMTHAGRAVIVSGSTVAIGLFSMVLLPIPVIRSIGIGGLLIPHRLRLRGDHVPARDAVAARPADQLRPRDAEADRRGHRRGARASGGAGRTSSCGARCSPPASGSRSSRC